MTGKHLHVPVNVELPHRPAVNDLSIMDSALLSLHYIRFICNGPVENEFSGNRNWWGPLIVHGANATRKIDQGKSLDPMVATFYN